MLVSLLLNLSFAVDNLEVAKEIAAQRQYLGSEVNDFFRGKSNLDEVLQAVSSENSSLANQLASAFKEKGLLGENSPFFGAARGFDQPDSQFPHDEIASGDGQEDSEYQRQTDRLGESETDPRLELPPVTVDEITPSSVKAPVERVTEKVDSPPTREIDAPKPKEAPRPAAKRTEKSSAPTPAGEGDSELRNLLEEMRAMKTEMAELREENKRLRSVLDAKSSGGDVNLDDYVTKKVFAKKLAESDAGFASIQLEQSHKDLEQSHKDLAKKVADGTATQGAGDGLWYNKVKGKANKYTLDNTDGKLAKWQSRLSGMSVEQLQKDMKETNLKAKENLKQHDELIKKIDVKIKEDLKEDNLNELKEKARLAGEALAEADKNLTEAKEEKTKIDKKVEAYKPLELFSVLEKYSNSGVAINKAIDIAKLDRPFLKELFADLSFYKDGKKLDKDGDPVDYMPEETKFSGREVKAIKDNIAAGALIKPSDTDSEGKKIEKPTQDDYKKYEEMQNPNYFDALNKAVESAQERVAQANSAVKKEEERLREVKNKHPLTAKKAEVENAHAALKGISAEAEKVREKSTASAMALLKKIAESELPEVDLSDKK